MSREDLDAYLLSFANTWLDFPFGPDTSVYKVGERDSDESKLFAIIQDTSRPLKISLKCDPQLAEVLREQYESIVPGYHLSKKHWNTILHTGQVPDDELKGFINLSYQLVSTTG